MHLAVISDLHLGSGGSTDLFGHDDYEFLKFLDFLESNFERIILLGDVWETLTGKSYGDPARQLAMAREHHSEIDRRFRRSRYTYLHGNHDLVAHTVDAAPEELSINADGLRLVFSHGHQGDGLTSRHRWLSEIGVWLGAWVRRVGLHAAYAFFARLEQLREGADPGVGRCLVRRWVEEFARVCHADIAVAGHTHVPVRAELDSCLFLNSGSCAEGNLSFLSLDTGSANFGVHSSY